MWIAGEALSESVLFVMGKMMSKNSISQTKLGIWKYGIAKHYTGRSQSVII